MSVFLYNYQHSTIDSQLTSDGNRIRGCVFAGVGEADLDFGDAVEFCEFRCGALQEKFRSTGGVAGDFEIQPARLTANAGAEGFGNGLLRGEARGVVKFRLFLSSAVSALGRSEQFR